MTRTTGLAALGALAWLAACGGGAAGGGSGGGGGGSPVGMEVVSATAIDGAVYEGQPAPDFTLRARATGDVARLAGVRLFVALDVTDPTLFQPQPEVTLDQDGLGASVRLLGLPVPAGPRTYLGTIQARVCLDAQCREPLPVVGGQVPYQLRVRAGLTLQSPSAGLVTPFGATPPPLTVPFGLPDGTVAWEVVPGRGAADFGALAAAPAPDGSAALVLSAARRQLPGTFVQEFLALRATTAEGVAFETELPVSLATTPSDAAWTYELPEARLEVRQGAAGLTAPTSAGVLFATSCADRWAWVATEYVAWPAEAAASPARDQWLVAWLPAEQGTTRRPAQTYDALLQAQACAAGACLPPGRYAAVLHYRLAPLDGPPQDQDFPVTLDVAP